MNVRHLIKQMLIPTVNLGISSRGSGSPGIIVLTVAGDVMYRKQGSFISPRMKERVKEICEAPITDVPLFMNEPDEVLKDIVQLRLDNADKDFYDYSLTVMAEVTDEPEDIFLPRSSGDSEPLDIDWGDGPEINL